MSRLVIRAGKVQYRLSQAKIKALKKKLREAIRAGHTLREMSSSPFFYDGKVTFQTLGRFINEKNYIPANIETCKTLDIVADQNPYRGLPKWYKRIPQALKFWDEKRSQIKSMSNEAKRQRKGK